MVSRTRIVIYFLLILFLSCRKEVKEEIPPKEEKIKEEKKFRTYVIYSIDEQTLKATPGTITLEEKENELENLKYLLSNYFSAKAKDLFPNNTNLRAIYPFENHIVLDINIPEDTIPLQSTLEELSFVECLAKTVCLNFQKYKSINILINGSQENNFIKHIALYVNYRP